MSLVLFTGGARCGKSSAAQRLAALRSSDGAPVTVVVFGRPSVDPEFAERVARHQASRPPGWLTVEASGSGSWYGDVSDESLVLVDCMGTALGLAMDEAYQALVSGALGDAEDAVLPEELEREVARRFDPIVEWLTQRHSDTIVVTNEVGDGVIPPYPSGRLFRDLLGRANRLLVTRADAAYLCVAGRLLDLAELPHDVSWPSD